MGFGFGAAIGAYFGTGKKSVLITGDGSFGMNLNELATAVSYNVPLVIVIVNNSALGMVRQMQTVFFDKRYSYTDINRKTDFVALAKAFGANGVAVKSINDLEEALKFAVSYDGPYVIDVSVDKDELVLPMISSEGDFDDMIVRNGK